MSTLATTKTQNKLQTIDKKEERFIPHDVIVSYDDITNSDVSHAEFRVYCAILGYAKGNGHLSMSAQNFLDDNPVFTERQFQRHCEALQQKGFLYRIQHPLNRRGSMRYLIPKPYWEAFTKYIIKKHKRADLAAEVEHFFKGGDYEALRKIYQIRINGSSNKKWSSPKFSTRRLTPPPSDTALTAASINNINIIKEKENSERGKSAPLFKDYLRKELAKLKLDEQKGMRLYQSCQKELDAYDNPTAGVVAALKGGYADEKIHKSEEKRAKEKEAHDKREKKAKRKQGAHQAAKAIQKYYAEQEVSEYHIYCDEYHATIHRDGSPTALRFDYAGDPTSLERLLAFARKHNIKIDLHKETLKKEIRECKAPEEFLDEKNPKVD